ncbi:MAG: rubredoxin-like domain-containing protein [Bacilli bacterium]
MKNILPDLFILGGNNYSERVFEGEIPLKKGMSYNSYLLIDDVTVLFDTVEVPLIDNFLSEIDTLLDNRDLDYFIIHHLEPDHTGATKKIIDKYPNATILISQLGLVLLKQFFPDLRKDIKVRIIKENDVLETKNHHFVFINAQMVHWPEVMFTYDSISKTLFSADAFGSFTVYDELDSKDYKNHDELIYEARRYYTNIVGRYGDQVKAVLEKAKKLEIERILPLHGPIHTKLIAEFIKYYDLWASYKEERDGVLIVVCSIYGHTLFAANKVQELLDDRNIESEIVNLNTVDVSVSLMKTFMYKNIILLAPTFNMGLFPKMEEYLSFLVSHNMCNRNFSIIENGSWAPQAKKLMLEYLSKLKNINIMPTSLTIKSALKEADIAVLNKIVDELLNFKIQTKEKENTHHFKCQICGYVYEGESLDDSFKCPLCGKGKEFFTQID